jgi:hypothetical protein
MLREIVSSYVHFYVIYTRKARSDLIDHLDQNDRQVEF